MSSLLKRLWFPPVLLLLCAGKALADEDAVPELTGDVWPALIKLVLALGLILVIIYGSVWLMKRFSLGKVVGNSELISVVDKRFLAPKQAVYLLKVGKQHLLVGSSEAGLTKIAALTSEDLEEKPLPPGTAPASSKFNRVLRQARNSFMPLLRNREASVEIESK